MGKTREDAIEQACKNAVRDVLFKGVQTPENTESSSRPLIREINAEEKYQYFFNPFFADGGRIPPVREHGGPPAQVRRRAGQLRAAALCGYRAGAAVGVAAIPGRTPYRQTIEKSVYEKISADRPVLRRNALAFRTGEETHADGHSQRHVVQHQRLYDRL